MEYTGRSIESKLIIENLGSERINGEKVYIKRNHTGNNTYFFLTNDTILRNPDSPTFSHVDATHETNFILPVSLKENSEWNLNSRPYVIENAIEYEVALQTSTPGIRLSKPLVMTYKVESLNETVNVPAGIFRNCALVSGWGTCKMSAIGGNFSGAIDVNVEHKDWYCPGIGLTKTVRSEVDPSSLIEPVTYRQELEKIVEKSFFIF